MIEYDLKDVEPQTNLALKFLKGMAVLFCQVMVVVIGNKYTGCLKNTFKNLGSGALIPKQGKRINNCQLPKPGDRSDFNTHKTC